MCGEKLPGVRPRSPAAGSPPRVRGKDLQMADQNNCYRITPACAGKSECLHHTRRRLEDHPRVCGEKEERMKVNNWLTGSPPRVRGKVNCAAVVACEIGITPACAGKSACARLTTSSGIGSPPRVRGKAIAVPRSMYSVRITPACAGKRSIRSGDFIPSRDHPRVCGEKSKKC